MNKKNRELKLEKSKSVWKKEKARYTKCGQSLFEVIFAIGVAALVLIGVASLAATSVRNSSFSRNNALATKYAQEAIEWLREQRDVNWVNFASGATGTTKNLGTLSWPPGGSCTISAEPIFCRTVTLTTVSANTIEAQVEVNWNDAQGMHKVRSVTKFTNWNR